MGLWESLDGAIDKVINYCLIKKKVCKWYQLFPLNLKVCENVWDVCFQWRIHRRREFQNVGQIIQNQIDDKDIFGRQWWW